MREHPEVPWIKLSKEDQRKLIGELGQRALDYAVDTGECVFCEVDGGGRHDNHCQLGLIFGWYDTEN